LHLNSKQGFMSKLRHINESFRDKVPALNLASKSGYPKTLLGITRFPQVMPI
jgi:hypothetical protein